jgi:hypothetical protein
VIACIDHMEHSVRLAARVIEGKGHRIITFGSGSPEKGLEPFARRRRYIYRKEAGVPRKARAPKLPLGIAAADVLADLKRSKDCNVDGQAFLASLANAAPATSSSSKRTFELWAQFGDPTTALSLAGGMDDLDKPIMFVKPTSIQVYFLLILFHPGGVSNALNPCSQESYSNLKRKKSRIMHDDTDVQALLSLQNPEKLRMFDDFQQDSTGGSSSRDNSNSGVNSSSTNNSSISPFDRPIASSSSTMDIPGFSDALKLNSEANHQSQSVC